MAASKEKLITVTRFQEIGDLLIILKADPILSKHTLIVGLKQKTKGKTKLAPSFIL